MADTRLEKKLHAKYELPTNSLISLYVHIFVHCRYTLCNKRNGGPKKDIVRISNLQDVSEVSGA